MLQKIIAIKNVGRFQNSAAGGDTTLKKHTFIYAANGYGKTTLCAILRSLKTGNGDHILGRTTLGASGAPEVNILTVAGSARFDGISWTDTHPHLAIFDGTFISENVYSGDIVDTDQKRGLYRVMVGSAGVTLAEQEATLSVESRTKTGEISAVEKALKSHVPAGMKLDAFLALPNVEELDQQISTQEIKLKTISEAAAIKVREALPTIEMPDPPPSLLEVLRSTLEHVADGAEQRISDHLRAHGMADGGDDWISEGLRHTSDSCAFCGQDVTGVDLIADYRAMYGESYRQLKNRIQELASAVESLFGGTAVSQLELNAERYKGAVEFWSERTQIAPPEFPLSARHAVRNFRAAVGALLIRKANAPLEPIELDGPAKAAVMAYDKELQNVTIFNKAVKAANHVIELTKKEAGEGNILPIKATLERLKNTKTRHTSPVRELCDERSERMKEKNEIENRKSKIREQLDTHTNNIVKPYQDRINDLLENFNAGFRIDQTEHNYLGGMATSTYQIVINEKLVNLGASNTPNRIPSFRNTLSAGDRSTLALAFFIAALERHKFIDSCTAVFDDPFTSQDAFRRRQTVHEIIKLGRKCRQVVVLSHDPGFLKQVWDKCEVAHRVSLGIVDHGQQGSKIKAINLDECCRGRTATDTDHLLAFHNDRVGEPIDIHRKMRTVLETHLRIHYSANFTDQDKWLGDMLRRIRDEGPTHPAHHLYDELNEINDSAVYHHGEDLSTNNVEHIDVQELAGLVKRTLRIINALQA